MINYSMFYLFWASVGLMFLASVAWFVFDLHRDYKECRIKQEYLEFVHTCEMLGIAIPSFEFYKSTCLTSEKQLEGLEKGLIVPIIYRRKK